METIAIAMGVNYMIGVVFYLFLWWKYKPRPGRKRNFVGSWILAPNLWVLVVILAIRANSKSNSKIKIK